MNKSLIGALVVAMALLPSFASATTLTPYNVDIGMSKRYNAPGVQSVEPYLSPTAGEASILAKEFVVDHWEVLVGCSAFSSVTCTGNIVT